MPLKNVKDCKRHRESLTSCAIRRSEIRHARGTSRRSRSADSVNLVGKFILPQRSVHSSRVIKPNKRFVESDESERKVSASPSGVTTPKVSDISDSKHCDTDNNWRAPVAGEPSGNRLILRKAKLQLHSTHNSPVHRQNEIHHQGPFSMPSSDAGANSTSGAPGVYYNIPF